jgi:hypothetical protein
MKSDQQLITGVVRDYFEGWFEGDADRMERALHSGLAKRSLGQVDRASQNLQMSTKKQMVAWTAAGEGKSEDPGGDRTIGIEIIDLHGNIASVVVRSRIYREYLHLVRTDAGWKIVNALWHYT